MTAQIVVVDDEPGIRDLVAVNLERAGHRVQRACDAESALEMLRESVPDLVIIDWMLPGMTGVELTRRMRADGRTRHVSIIILTARDQEKDKVIALDSGADDYVTKPFSPRELLSRIAAVLRRRAPQASQSVIDMHGLRIDPIAGRLLVGGSEVELSQAEFRLLHYFMSHSDHVHSRAQLLDKVWGDRFVGEERTVDVHVRRLRSALKPTGHSQMIETVRGSGYFFNTGAS